jgi:hypothetical protein
MALSAAARRRLEVAMAHRATSVEVADAIDNGGNPQAAAVAALGVTTDLTGVDGVGDNAADLATTEARLDDIEAKVDELIAALKSAGVMAS